MSSQIDKLGELFRLREDFMSTLRERVPDVYSTWPLDPTSKENQIHIRDMALRGVEEMFEALQHLKNSKPHRQTDMPDFDREAFLEETVDAFNYFLSVLILLGVSSDELHEAYEKKHLKIMERIRDGY
jgi:hypothetical protein